MSELEQKLPLPDEPNGASKAPLWSESPPEEHWEHDLLNRLAFATLNEQRRARRWNIFFKILLFIYLFILLFLMNPEWSHWLSDIEKVSGGQHTALVELQGQIAADTEASAEKVIAGLDRAFKDADTKGVILRINSPGGSPVQAGYINEEIKRLRKEYPKKPLYAVITDLCASGGYYVAVAADKIYVDKASLVGSIGVLMNGFGFVGTIEKLGIERRLITAGEQKGFLDPFSPLKTEAATHVQNLLNIIHAQFIEVVKTGRKQSFRFVPESDTKKKDEKSTESAAKEQERLLEEKDKLLENPALFSGLMWTGEEAIKLGLVDDFGNTNKIAREIIGAEKIIDFTQKPNYLDRFTEQLGSAVANVLTHRFTQSTLQ